MNSNESYDNFLSNQGKLLRKARRNSNLTQEQVASHFGISQDVISKYERGKSDITPYKLREFSKLYEKPITFFFMDSPKPKSTQVDH